MKRPLQHAFGAAALAGGLVLLGVQAALADDGMTDGGIISETDIAATSGNLSPSVQATVCGNSVAVADARAASECDGAHAATSHGSARRQAGTGARPPDPGEVAGDVEAGAGSFGPGKAAGDVGDEVAGSARRAPPGPSTAVLDRRLAGAGGGPAAFARRAATGAMPATGASLRRHVAWATVFFLSGAGLLARDALTG